MPEPDPIRPSRGIEDVRRFAIEWRRRLLARAGGNSVRLSEEQFGQLVALNTVIYYIDEG